MRVNAKELEKTDVDFKQKTSLQKKLQIFDFISLIFKRFIHLKTITTITANSNDVIRNYDDF